MTFLWLLPIGWKVCCTCTRIYVAAVPESLSLYLSFFFFFFFFFFTEVSQLTVAVRWLGTFANILFFLAPEWHFQCNFENGQVNVWSKHKACWLANIWFSCSRMLFFCDDMLKKTSASGGVAPDPRIIFLLFHFFPVPCLLKGSVQRKS